MSEPRDEPTCPKCGAAMAGTTPAPDSVRKAMAARFSRQAATPPALWAAYEQVLA